MKSYACVCLDSDAMADSREDPEDSKRSRLFAERHAYIGSNKEFATPNCWDALANVISEAFPSVPPAAKTLGASRASGV